MAANIQCLQRIYRKILPSSIGHREVERVARLQSDIVGRHNEPQFPVVVCRLPLLYSQGRGRLRGFYEADRRVARMDPASDGADMVLGPHFSTKFIQAASSWCATGFRI